MNAIWAGISPYWAWIKLGALVAVCAGCYVYGGSNAKARCERDSLAKENKALAQAIADNAKANDERRKAEDKLAKALTKKPQTGKKVNDAVMANPTDPKCVVPDDVIAGMQDGIDAGKDSAR